MAEDCSRCRFTEQWRTLQRQSMEMRPLPAHGPAQVRVGMAHVVAVRFEVQSEEGALLRDANLFLPPGFREEELFEILARVSNDLVHGAPSLCGEPECQQHAMEYRDEYILYCTPQGIVEEQELLEEPPFPIPGEDE